MKIYFCDMCNESIPLVDIKDGKASTIKGKIFCGACNPLNTVTSTVRKGGGLLASVVVFVLCGGAAAGAWYYTFDLSKRVDSMPRYEQSIEELGQQLEQGLAGLQADLAGMAEMKRDVSRVREEQIKLATTVSDRGHRLDKIEQSVQSLRTLLDALRSDRELLQKLELRQAELGQSLATVRESLAGVEGRLSGLTVGISPVDRGSEAPAEPDAPEFDENVRRLLSELDSRDASVRWSAVDLLAKERDPALIPYLIPLLDDPDAFVQFRVISTLRDLNARSAVAKLIELLRDADAIVREEALEALVTLTGNPLRFDVAAGTSSEREKGVQAWEDWYQKNKGRFEGAVDG